MLRFLLHAAYGALPGPPGAGKSTFIEALGMHLIALGHRHVPAPCV
jgi:putative protein kinase ArgK-like GTPase of G3E family